MPKQSDALQATWKALGLVSLAYAELGIITSPQYTTAERKDAAKSVAGNLSKAMRVLGKVKIPKT